MLRKLTEAGKGRTAAKLRSYVRAAYALAVKVETHPGTPSAMLGFRIEINPAQTISALTEYNKARERVLSEPELRAYWSALREIEGTASDGLQLAVILGGQRPAQLLRAKVQDVDLHGRVIKLFDHKGKRAQPRVHVLPIPELALPIVERLIAGSEKLDTDWLFSTRGKAPLRPETVSVLVARIVKQLIAKPQDERVVKIDFELRDIRRTCETLLARIGISRDTRAQLQSHGLGGIQQIHYDKHDYMPEKSNALRAWSAFLQQKKTADGNVVPIHAEKAA